MSAPPPSRLLLQKDETPLYIFERKFVEIAPVLREHYSTAALQVSEYHHGAPPLACPRTLPFPSASVHTPTGHEPWAHACSGVSRGPV